jgi:hypothetical protein
MSLKIEQRLMKSQFTEAEPTIYSTGVYLIPMKILLNGKERFVWVANEFDNDTFIDGKCVSPIIFSNNFNKMFIE